MLTKDTRPTHLRLSCIPGGTANRCMMETFGADVSTAPDGDNPWNAFVLPWSGIPWLSVVLHERERMVLPCPASCMPWEECPTEFPLNACYYHVMPKIGLVTRTVCVAATCHVLLMGDAHLLYCAQDDGSPEPAGEEAARFLRGVMDTVSKGAWPAYKERIHPLTRQAMAQRRQRTHRDDHNLAFWTHAREWLVKRWEIGAVKAGPLGTFVVTTREDHFLLAEKGWEQDQPFEWLLVKVSADGKHPARWWVLDRRGGTDNFPVEGIERGFAEALRFNRPQDVETPQTAMESYARKVQGLVRGTLSVPHAIPQNQRNAMSCRVRILVDARGKVMSRFVVKASGNPQFDRAVIRAVDTASPFPPPAPEVVDRVERGLEVELRAR